MAILANVARLYVAQILTGRVDTVVTTCTIPSDIQVIEICRSPGIGRMTIVTGLAACEMGWVLARGSDTVVTRTTGAYDL